jgi:hypothetical protein
VLNNQTKQFEKYCFKEIYRAELGYYHVKKGNKQDEWDFDWRKPFINKSRVFGLFVLGNKSLQGLVAVKENYDEEFLCLELEIVESAPQNKKMAKGHINKNRLYCNIGKTLIALFTSKTSKLDLYASLGAEYKGYQDMLFYPEISLRVVADYLAGGVTWCTN